MYANTSNNPTESFNFENMQQGVHGNTMPSADGAFQVTVDPNVPRKQPDAPQIETHINFVVAKKDGKLWIKHQTLITDWKPLKYYETGIARAIADNAKR